MTVTTWLSWLIQHNYNQSTEYFSYSSYSVLYIHKQFPLRVTSLTFQHGHLRQQQSQGQGTASLMHYTWSLSYSSERTCINLCSTQRAIINIQQTAVWTAPKISYATRTCVWLVIKMLDLQPHIWLGKDTKPLGALHCWSEFASVFVICCQIVIMHTLNLFISAWPSFRKSNIIHWIYFVKLKVF